MLPISLRMRCVFNGDSFDTPTIPLHSIIFTYRGGFPTRQWWHCVDERKDGEEPWQKYPTFPRYWCQIILKARVQICILMSLIVDSALGKTHCHWSLDYLNGYARLGYLQSTYPWMMMDRCHLRSSNHWGRYNQDRSSSSPWLPQLFI